MVRGFNFFDCNNHFSVVTCPIGPCKKDTFYTGEKKLWIFKTAHRNRAGPLERAPVINGVRQNVECLIAASNGNHSAFGTPITHRMNGEIKLASGAMQFNTQEAVDMVMNTPIINNGSDGKLVLVFTSIEVQTKVQPIIHPMSDPSDPTNFMAVHHFTLNGVRTTKQSSALQKMIYQIQMKNYEKGLALLTYEERLAHYENTLGLLTYEERLAHMSLGGKGGHANGWDQFTIVHGIANEDIVFHRDHGKGIVKTVGKPAQNGNDLGRAQVVFEKSPRNLQQVGISALKCDGKPCQFVKEYKLDKKKWRTDKLTNTPYHTITKGDTVYHKKHGSGTVKSIQKPMEMREGRARVVFVNSPDKTKRVQITALTCEGIRCRNALLAAYFK